MKQLLQKRVLIKIGGAALQNDAVVESICQDVQLLRATGMSVVLVHGGGPAINAELERRKISWKFIDGQRVTTPEMMDVIEMVLCGQINRKLVRALNTAGVRAVGLSGTDASTLSCTQSSSSLQRVGKIEQVDTSLIRSILRESVPVLAPIGIGRNGEAFNINADWAASRIAQALSVSTMVFLTDQDGIWNSSKEVRAELGASGLRALVDEGAIQGGMLAKTHAILDALSYGVKRIHVLNAQKPHALVDQLLSSQPSGTLCQPELELAYASC